MADERTASQGTPDSGADETGTPPLTAFDFLGGGYAVARNTRLVGYALTVVIVVVITVIVVTMAPGVLQERQQAGSVGELAQVRDNAERDLQQRFGAQNSESRLRAHLEVRTGELGTALADEVDVVAVLQDVKQHTPAGIDVSAITLQPPTGTPNPAVAAAAPDTGTAVTRVQLKVNALSFDQVAAWISALQTVPYLREVEQGTTWSGDPSGGTIEITTVAQLDTTVIGSRFHSLDQALNPDTPRPRRSR